MLAKVVGLVLLGVMAGALLWAAGEQHYQGCVEARTAAALANGRVTDSILESSGGRFADEEPRAIAYVPAGVKLGKCSRWPL